MNQPSAKQLAMCQKHCGPMGKTGYHSLLCPLSCVDHPSRPGNTFRPTEVDDPDIGMELDRQDLNENGSVCLAGNPTPGGDQCGFPGCVCGPERELPILSKECDAVDCAHCSDPEANCCECPCHHAPFVKQVSGTLADEHAAHGDTVTFDLTPRGCQTPEGNARVNAAMLTAERAGLRFAGLAASAIAQGWLRPRPDEIDSWSHLNVAKEEWQEAQIELLRAVAGR